MLTPVSSQNEHENRQEMTSGKKEFVLRILIIPHNLLITTKSSLFTLEQKHLLPLQLSSRGTGFRRK